MGGGFSMSSTDSSIILSDCYVVKVIMERVERFVNYFATSRAVGYVGFQQASAG